ncbi:MAG: OmpA family protein [Bacteroidia bacterium]
MKKTLLFLWLGAISLTLTAQVAFWQKYLGSEGFDFGKRLLLNADGTFILGGEIPSESSLAGETPANQRDKDIIILKMATQDKVFWRVQWGGNGEDILHDLISTQDGGYLAIGSTASSELEGFHGDTDVFILKLDGLGQIEWTKILGGKGDDKGICAIQTSERDFVIGGESGSQNGSMQSPHHGGFDSWIAKINQYGGLIWEKHFGGLGNEKTVRIHEFTPGKYFVINSSDRRDQDVTLNFGQKDVWVFMLNEQKEIEWQQNFGGTRNDDIADSHLDSKGMLTMAGTTFSADGHIENQRGLGDYWLLQIDPLGKKQWSQTYGGTKPDGVSGMTATKDGGFILCGMTKSRSIDIERNNGYFDAWIVKANDRGERIWSRTIGFEAMDEMNDIIELPEGGYIMLGTVQQLAGGTSLAGHQGNGDIWLTNLSDPQVPRLRPFVTPPILSGKIIDKVSGEPLQANVLLTDNATLDSITKAISEPTDGSFVLLMPPYGLVSMSALRPGYMLYGEDMRTDTMLDKTITEKTIALEPIEVGSSLILRLIYFNSGKWDLLPASFAELERVVKFMKINPSVHIEVVGHTDNTGNRAEKTQLSLFRSQAVQNYLVSKGIQKARIRVKGAGMSQPISSNSSSEGRRKNRRVEFTVIRK